jgi:SAM-dependent methyltransferase
MTHEASELNVSSSFHALRFGRAAARYEARARVQAHMAQVLLDLWGDRPAPANILEFGCGTGLLTRALHARFPGVSLTATDASPEMWALAQESLKDSGKIPVAFATQNARGDEPPQPGLLRAASHNSFDLVAAGALVQWFPDLAAHFRFAALLAAPDARYLVSGFDAANFPEINALLRKPPFEYRSFPGHTQAEFETAANAAGWTVTTFLGWEESEVLPTPRAVLKLLQELGSVRDPREGGRMNRANLAHFLTEYERLYSTDENGGGVRLTWKPWAALLTRS